MEHTGDEIGALNEMLKASFGWKARMMGDGILPVLERGDGICALPHVLRGFFQRFPNNNVLKKWILDIETGIEKAYKEHNTKVSDIPPNCNNL